MPWAFAATAIVLPALALAAPLGVAPLLTVAAAALLLAAPRRVLAGARTLWPLAALWAALAAWATVSAAWSILPRHSLLEGLRLFAIGAEGMIVLGAALTLLPVEAAFVRRAVVAGVLGALAVSALAIAIHHPAGALGRYDRGMTTLVLALWPALLGLGPRLAKIVLAAATFAVVSVMASSAALLALLVGGGVYAAAWAWPRGVAAALAAGLLGIAVLLPLATPSDEAVLALQEHAPWIRNSGIHRLLIWRFTADRIAERPLLGWGMDASRALPGGKTDLPAALPGIGLPPGAQALPLHPHNAALQWEVELGVPGTALALALAAFGLARAGSRMETRAGRADALGWAGAALVIGLLSYGIWQAWWLSSLWLTLSLVAASAAHDG